jgi:glycosyltransferase involved in cell wall biosynthesis
MIDISILLPVHGDGAYLKDCLMSLRQLSFKYSAELVIVVDRVSQRNFELIEQYETFLTKKVIINNNAGLVNSLNLGILNSEGKYIARIDHDDMIQSTRLEKQLLFLNSNPDYILVGSNVRLIDSLGNFIRESAYPIQHDEIAEALKVKNVFAHPSVMYKKSAVIEAQMYRKFYEGGEDYDLWLRLLKLGKVANLEESLTHYRQHSQQMSTMSAKRQWIITQAVKTSSKLRSKEAAELDAKYFSIEDWYTDSPKIKLQYAITAFRRFLKIFIFQKIWANFVKL